MSTSLKEIYICVATKGQGTHLFSRCPLLKNVLDVSISPVVHMLDNRYSSPTTYKMVVANQPDILVVYKQE